MGLRRAEFCATRLLKSRFCVGLSVGVSTRSGYTRPQASIVVRNMAVGLSAQLGGLWNALPALHHGFCSRSPVGVCGRIAWSRAHSFAEQHRLELLNNYCAAKAGGFLVWEVPAQRFPRHVSEEFFHVEVSLPNTAAVRTLWKSFSDHRSSGSSEASKASQGNLLRPCNIEIQHASMHLAM